MALPIFEKGTSLELRQSKISPLAARFKTIVWLKHAFAIPLTVERSPRPR